MRDFKLLRLEMTKHPWVVLIFTAVLFLIVVPLRIGFADLGPCQLTINPAVGGTTTPPPGNCSCGYATNVTITAIPDPGYIFDYWTGGSGNILGGANPITFMIASDLTLQPIYENATSAKRTLTILAGNNGTTNPPPGTYTHDHGEKHNGDCDSSEWNLFWRLVFGPSKR